MKRRDFLDLFNPDYCDKKLNYICDIDMESKSTDELIIKEVRKTFPVNLEEDHNRLFNVFPDWLFMDDNPEEDGWRYQAKINLNELYDNYDFITEPEEVTIFRLCNENQKGIYDLGLGYKYLKTGESPHEDPSLNIIFHNMFTESEYAKKWYFACKDIQQVKIWFDNPLVLQDLEKFGLKIAEIKIPENFVVEGKEQVIYRPDKINNITFHPLSIVHDEKPTFASKKIKI